MNVFGAAAIPGSDRSTRVLLAATLCACSPQSQVVSSSTATGIATESTPEGGDGSGVGSQDGDPDSQPDVGVLCWENDDWACNPWQDQCPEGAKCASGGGEPPHCVEVFEPADLLGESCEQLGLPGEDSCERGTVCLLLDGDLVPSCVRTCTCEPSSGCPGACEQCIVGGSGEFAYCAKQCDPLQADCSCHLGSGDESFACTNSGSASVGETCEDSFACADGFECTLQGAPGCPRGTGCCTSVCDASVRGACSAVGDGIECVPLGLACHPLVGLCLQSN